MTSIAVNAQEVVLPAPATTASSLPVVQALAARHSVRSYSDKALSLEELSTLLWAACGESRDAEHITAPSAMNRQEVRVYAFTADGAYEYHAHGHTLSLVAAGDHRALVAGPQDFVCAAPVSIVLVVDYAKFGSMDAHSVEMCCVDVGNISENINLYCAAVGLATVPRGTMDVAGIKALLGLGAQQVPVLNNPVGWEK